MEPEPPGAAFFTLEPEPEPTQVGRSRSWLLDLGHLEPEPPKKVAAPQHWIHSPVELVLVEEVVEEGDGLNGLA